MLLSFFTQKIRQLPKGKHPDALIFAFQSMEGTVLAVGIARALVACVYLFNRGIDRTQEHHKLTAFTFERSLLR